MSDQKTLQAWQRYMRELGDAHAHAVDLLTTLTDSDTSSAQLRVATARCDEVATRAQRALTAALMLQLRAQEAFEAADGR